MQQAKSILPNPNLPNCLVVAACRDSDELVMTMLREVRGADNLGEEPPFLFAGIGWTHVDVDFLPISKHIVLEQQIIHRRPLRKVFRKVERVAGGRGALSCDLACNHAGVLPNAGVL